MRDLEQSIAEWRQTMSAAPNIGPDTIAELETHLRETVEQLMRSGMSEAEAFERAIAQLGPPSKMAAEFQKLNAFTWLPFRIVTAIAGAAALLLSTYMFSAFQHRHSDLLLATHVYAVTLGYSLGLLLGVLGICFVAQRCHAELPPRRAEALGRGAYRFAAVACGLSALGMILGMFWSHREWGRFWGWDVREVGALSVVVWLAGVLIAHRSRRFTVRALFLSGLIASNVVLSAWFGPNLVKWGQLHSYGMNVHGSVFVMVALAINLMFFLIGLAPAGWLRWHKRRAHEDEARV
jgi:hypothetical protein